nr:MAG TPA: hypothetical protein [Caudoviricetes sp.]
MHLSFRTFFVYLSFNTTLKRFTILCRFLSGVLYYIL